MTKIITEKQKELQVKTLVYEDDVDDKKGTIRHRVWEEGILDYEIWKQDQYSQDTLSILKSFHESEQNQIQWQIRVYLSHFNGKVRGSCVSELFVSDAREGITIKYTKLKTLTDLDEVQKKVSSHDYKILKRDAGKLVIPEVYYDAYEHA